MIGYACNIKPAWMKYARQILSENLSQGEYKSKLNDYLSFEIDSPVRLRKSREILMHVWYYDNDVITPIRQEALKLIRKYPDYEIPIGLCLIYIAYPVVADICRIIGRLLDFQEYFTNGILKHRLYDEWGERGSLEGTSRRVTLTLKDMGIIKVTSRTRYQPEVIDIKEDDVSAFLIYIAMKINGTSYYPLSSLNSFNLLFPFRYTISKERLICDEHFMVSTFDREYCVSLG